MHECVQVCDGVFVQECVCMCVVVVMCICVLRGGLILFNLSFR